MKNKGAYFLQIGAGELSSSSSPAGLVGFAAELAPSVLEVSYAFAASVAAF